MLLPLALLPNHLLKAKSLCVCALCVPTCRNQSLFSTQDKKSRRAVRTARGIFGSFSWLRTSSNWNASLVARLWLSSGSSKRCQKTTWFSLSFGSLVGLLTSTKTAVSKYNREGSLTPGCNFSSKVSKTARACKQLSKCQFSKWDMSFCEVPASPGPIVNSSIPWRALFISRSSASHALSCCIAIAVVAAKALYESCPTSRPKFNALLLQATITANGMEGAGFASGPFAECTSATLAQCISINEAADKDALASAFPLFKSSLLRSSTRFHCSAARCSRWHSTLVKPGRTASCEALRSRRAIRTCANNIKAKSRVTKLSAIFPRHCTSRRPSSICASSHSFTAKMLRSVSEKVASPWPNQSHPLAICPRAFIASNRSLWFSVWLTLGLFNTFKLPAKAISSAMASSEGLESPALLKADLVYRDIEAKGIGMKSNFTEMVLLKINKTVMRTDEERNLCGRNMFTVNCKSSLTTSVTNVLCRFLSLLLSEVHPANASMRPSALSTRSAAGVVWSSHLT